MTGYAEASAEPRESIARAGPEVLHTSVEMRSVNNRFLDVAVRVPDEYRPLEPKLRELVANRCKRGKVEVRVSVGAADAGIAPAAPSPLELAALGRLEQAIRDQLPDARPLSVHEILHWCRDRSAPPADADAVLEAAARCAERLADARAREGARLGAFLGERVGALRALAATAAPLLGAAVARQQQRFVERWNDALAAAQPAFGNAAPVSREAAAERALGEAAAYAIRIDVAEELGRLGSHLDEVERLVAKGGEIGKRLEFLIQELLREANTLGSKAASLELTAVSVDMKVAIEQLREQVQNLE